MATEVGSPGHDLSRGTASTRALTVADLDAVLAVQRAAYGDAYQESASVLARKLALAPGACWIAELDGRGVGYVFAHPWAGMEPPALHAELPCLPEGERLAFLHDLAVSPEARGAGVAAVLLDRVRDWCTRSGLRRMVLVALEDAVAFWLRHDFVLIDQPVPPSYGDGARLMAARQSSSRPS